MNIANPANRLKARARRYGFVVLLQPDRPSGWTALVRPAGTALREPIEVSAPTRDEAIALAGKVFEEQLIAQLVDTLSEGGHEVPNWEPGVAWDDHVDRLHAAVRDAGLAR
ncbi:MAG: hypothetical protein ACR2JV_01775 [Gaiellales bacterium]